MQDGHVFNTKDFYTAVVLRVLDFPLEKLARKTGDPAIFVFSDPNNKAEQVIKDYWDRNLPIPDARAFVEAISELKTRLYGESR